MTGARISSNLPAMAWNCPRSSPEDSGTLTGSTPGKIWVRVAAKGADDQPGPWSDAAEDLVR